MGARNGGAGRRGSGKRTGNKSGNKNHRSLAGRKARRITKRDQSRHVLSRINKRLRASQS